MSRSRQRGACGRALRTALGGKVQKGMGYAKAFDTGAFRDRVEAGAAVLYPVDPGMT